MRTARGRRVEDTGAADLRYVRRYLALRARMDAAFDRWAAARPAGVDAARTDYYALVQEMRDLTANRSR